MVLLLRLLCFVLSILLSPGIVRSFFACGFTLQNVVPSPAATTLQATNDDDDLVAKRIIVSGDVQGGYYRACVINEVSTLLLVCMTNARAACPSTPTESVVFFF